MHRFEKLRDWLLMALALGAGMIINLVLDIRESEGKSPPQVAYAPAAVAAAVPTLPELAAGALTIRDLSWPLNKENAYWPGENYRPFELHTIATLEKDGVLSKAFCLARAPGHPPGRAQSF